VCLREAAKAAVAIHKSLKDRGSGLLRFDRNDVNMPARSRLNAAGITRDLLKFKDPGERQAASGVTANGELLKRIRRHLRSRGRKIAMKAWLQARPEPAKLQLPAGA
jgi:hypothetical protein